MVSLDSLHSPIGLVAGNGYFPQEFVQNAAARSLEVCVVGLRGEANPELASIAKTFDWASVGQLGKMVKIFRKLGVGQVAFAGGVTRVRFVDGFRMDWRSIRMLSTLRTFNDDSILRGIIREFERDGIEVIAASLLLEKSVPQEGVLGRRGLSAEEEADVQIGWAAAKTLGSLDVGQSVVVRNKTVVAVEAVEGTDAVIRRVADVRGKGGVLVKLAKPMQDLRVDLPAVGVTTIQEMAKSGLTALVVEAGKSLMMKPQEVVEAADSLNIAVVARSSSGGL
jgi:DUF1009 family protein